MTFGFKGQPMHGDEGKNFSTLMDIAPWAISVMGKNGQYEFFNPEFSRIFGYTLEDIPTEKDWFIKVFRDSNDVEPSGAAWKRDREKSILTGRSSREFKIKSKDGLAKVVRFRSMLLDDGDLLTIYGDITELRNHEAQIRQVKKMESLGTLAGGIAHDLNNILTPIMLRTEMALAQMPSGSPSRHHLEQVLSSCERARHLVKHLITFSHMPEHERKPLQLSLVVKESVKLLRASLPSTLEIRQDIRDNSGLVLADLSQMHQLIVTLCTDGARSMRGKGGVIEVSLSDLWLDHDSVDHLSNLEPGPYVRLTIRSLGSESDTNAEEISKSQEMDESLSVARGIVAGHEGDIIVDNQAAKGTVFHVFFPRIENAGHVEAEGASSLPRGAERILLVDDEEAIVETVKQMLDRLGYIVVPRTSSIEALETFRKDPEGFDLVITDLTMPRMTGAEFTKELMRLRPDIPIILCTGYSELMGEEEAKAMGIKEFFKKPIRAQKMLEKIRHVLDKKSA
jgi:PAS domain S-box-containing protein